MSHMAGNRRKIEIVKGPFAFDQDAGKRCSDQEQSSRQKSEGLCRGMA